MKARIKLHNCMSGRFIGSGRKIEGGFLATHKVDFNAHVDGDDWNHLAEDILLKPPVGSQGLSNVRESIEYLTNIVDGSGQGYVTIGEGYDNCAGDLSQAFFEAFSNPRLDKGGVVFVRSGSYCIKNTVNVPLGITIMGEQGGVIISSEIGDLPAFSFSKSQSSNYVQTGVFQEIEGSDSNVIMGLSIYDNKNNVYQSGASSMPSVPMLRCAKGANLTVIDCRLIGKVVSQPLSISHRAISFSGSNTSTPNVLRVINTVIDGFKSAISFENSNGPGDILLVDGCNIRTFGDGLETSWPIPFSDIRSGISITPCTAIISNNKFTSILSSSGALGLVWGGGPFIFIKSGAGPLSGCSIQLSGNSGTYIDQQSIVPSSSKIPMVYDNRTSGGNLSIIGNNTWAGKSYSFGNIDIVSSNDSLIQPNTTPFGLAQLVSTGREIRIEKGSSDLVTDLILDPANILDSPTSGYNKFTVVVDTYSSDVIVNINGSNYSNIPVGTEMFLTIYKSIGNGFITVNWNGSFRFDGASDIGVNNGLYAIYSWKIVRQDVLPAFMNNFRYLVYRYPDIII